MNVIQTVPGEFTLGYVITKREGWRYCQAIDEIPIDWTPMLEEAQLHESRTLAIRASLLAWRDPWVHEELGLQVRRVARCTKCDGRGVGCGHCAGSGREMRD